MVFIAIGWGVTEETWYPDKAKTGSDWTLPEGLQPLARHKQAITVVQNVYHKHSSDAHNPSMFWLTGADRYGVPGKSFNNTISVDQVAAEQFGRDTRFASLSLCASSAEGGHGQMQWSRQGKPLPGIENPVAAYHKLFSDEKTPLEVRQRELVRQKSVLDVVLLADGGELARRCDGKEPVVGRPGPEEIGEPVGQLDAREGHAGR